MKNQELLIQTPQDSQGMRMRWGTVQSDGSVQLDHNGGTINPPALVNTYPGDRVSVDIYGLGRRVTGRLPRKRNISGENLNSLTVPGTYWINGSSTASLALNYPIVMDGSLEVIDAGDHIHQEYRTWPFSVGGARRFTRTLYYGDWRPWEEISVGPVVSRGWTTINDFGAAWSHFGQGFAPARCRFIENGSAVRLDGVIGGGNLPLLARVPTEFRPRYAQLLPWNAWTSPTAAARIDVATDGRINLTGSLGRPSWVSFSGLTYPLD